MKNAFVLAAPATIRDADTASVRNRDRGTTEWRRATADRRSILFIRPLLSLLLVTVTVSLLTLNTRGAEPVHNTRQLVEEIRSADSAVQNSKSDPAVLDEIRRATWELLLGEYTAAHESLSLPTTSINSLLNGREHLEQIEAVIEKDPQLEDKISKEPLLAIRLDMARVRDERFEEKEEISREHEIARLEQLRQIVNDYRDLNESLIRWQIYQVLEDADKSSQTAQHTLATLNKVFDEVRRRRDFHLFDNEPAVEGTNEFKIVETEPTPFSTEPLSMLKALQGLTYYNLVRAMDEPDAEILEQAQQWAEAALDDEKNRPDLPAGADPSNLLAKLVLGLVEDAHGTRLAFDSEAANRALAAEHYSQARINFTDFLELLTTSGFDDTTQLKQQAESKLKQLINSDSLTAQARQKFKTGHPKAARQALVEATKRHREQETSLEAIEIGMRAGLPVNQLQQEWNQYVDLGIIKPDSPLAQLVLAKIRNRRAGEALSTVDADEKKQAGEELRQVAQKLKGWVDEGKISKQLRSVIKANYALAIIYSWAIAVPADDNVPIRAEDIEAAYRHAKDAEFYLASELEGLDPANDTMVVIGNREALVASRIAAGHLAAMFLDDWRDESQTFFAAAAAEAAKLDMATPVLPLIGSPLLQQVFNQSKGGQIKLANQERQRRHMVTRCLEAMFTSRFGDPVSGAEQMEEAVTAGAAAGGEGKGQQVDAARLSAGADGFDAKVSLPDTIRAFSVLTDIEADRFSQAVIKAVSLASKSEIEVETVDSLTNDQLAACLQATQSPLVAFTYAKSLETYAVQIPLAESLALRTLLLDGARKAYLRGAQLLKSERLAGRFPHIVALINQATENLASPNLYLDRAADLAVNRRLPEAIATATDGLARHPSHQPLWRAYFQAQIEYGKANLGNDTESLNDVLSQLENTNKKELVSNYEAAFGAATVLELIGQQEKAQQKYEEALRQATTPQERIRARSNAARIRTVLSINR